MRELKFRAFVEVNGKPLFTYSSDIGLLAFFRKFEYDKNIEQYTGLKDKNGKKIYVGDIVKHQKVISSNQDFFGTTECNGVVEWDDENTGYYPFNSYYALWDLRHLAKDIEVIGNIHENPELLRGEE